MKWVAFFVAVFVLVPLLGAHLRKHPERARWVLLLVGVDLFNPAHINLLSDENYRGDSRGIELTSVDLLLWGLYLGVRHRPGPGPRAPRLILVRLFYFAAALASLSATPDMLRSSFSVWKLLRMFLDFEILRYAFADLRILQGGLEGLATGVVLQSLLALKQKYLLHAIRVMGSMPHPNSLAMIVNLIAPTAFALLLSGRGKRVTVPVVALGGISVIMTLSRGGMMMFAMSLGLTALISVARKPTARKVRILALGFLGVVVVLARSIDTIIERFTSAPKESELARKLFNQAAARMAHDHTFGVGINMYSWVLDHGGYADALHIEPGDRNGIAHHVYWLTTAELGYVGAVAYGLLLAHVMFLFLRVATRRGLVGDLGLGMTLGMATMYLQGTAEWIARQTAQSYCFWLMAAAASALHVHRIRDDE